jgi:glycosyltransferase involved in cell wall biosynthesis
VKIALVTDTYFPRVNGVSASTRLFAGELRRLGTEVFVYAPAYPGQEEEPGVVRFPSRYLWFDPEDRLARPGYPQGVRHFMEQGFDVVHTQTPFSLGRAALGWARRSGAVPIHTYHTLFVAYVEHYLKLVPRAVSIPLVRWASRRYCDACRRVVVPSTAMRDELLSYGVRTPVEVIPTGIALERFEGRDRWRVRREAGVPDTAPLLLFMGRVAEEKNVDFLVDVVEALKPRHPELRFWIAGEGAAKPRLQRLVSERGLSGTVRFLGYLARDDWRDCYAAADVFVFASVTETQGLVVTEAMAAETPVVAVGAMGIRDVMGEGRGGIVTRLDRGEFGAAVERLLGDPGLHAAKRREALDEARRWSAGTMAERMLALYRDAVAEGRSRLAG